MKRVFPILYAICALFGCAKSERPLSEWMKEGKELRILATTAQIGDLAAFVGGERARNWTLISGDGNPHTYELVKGDGEKIQRADLVFYHGLGLEHGASLSSLLRRTPKAVSVGDAIASRHPEQMLKKGEVIDPHIWMDIPLWKEAIDPIVSALSSLDPRGAIYYAQRGEELGQKMEEADREIHSLLQQVPSEKRYLVTSHDAFHYFTRRYLANPGEENWAERFAAPEGLAPEGQLSPLDLRNVVHFLRDHNISILFPESNVNRDSIRKIATAGRELGLEIRICPEPLYGDSTSGLPYLDAMRKNGRVIATHLKGEGE